MKWLIAILSIISIAVLSGCTTPTVQTGNGISIETFEPDFQTVYSGEIVNFNLKIKNTGSITARAVHAELLGVDQDWCCEPAGNGTWIKPGNEKLPNEPECQYTGSGFPLNAPDPFWGTQGEEHVCTWTYKIPQFPKGFSRDYQPTVRVFYDYTTTLVQTINTLSREEMLDIQRSSQTLPNQATSLTNGPLSIKAEMASPLRVSEGGVTFPIKITIDNVGGGTTCLPGRCKKASAEGEVWNRINLEIIGVQLSDCEQNMQLELYKGQTTVTCQASITGLKMTGPEQSILTITADYGYFIEKSASITVKAEQV